MNEISKNQEAIRSYLLGEMAETERARLEDRFLGDAEVFEEIEDAENDLVDDYVAGRLGAPEHKLFESYYLSLPANRAKVESARFLRSELQSEKEAATAVVETGAEKPAGFWRSIQNLFAPGSLVPAAAAGFAVLLVIVVGGLWFAFRPQPNDVIVYSPTPAAPPANTPVQPPTPRVTPEAANNNAPANTDQIQPGVISPPPPPAQRNANNAAPSKETPRANDPKENAPSGAATPRRTPSEQSSVTLALVMGLVRGGGETNKLVLPKNARQVRLTFDLPAAGKYKQVEARIETVAGARVWSGRIKQSPGGVGGRRVALNLPANLFGDEDYLLIASGADETGERKDFAQFYFNSERK